MPSTMRRIAVIGPVASGKTTLGRRLGALLDLPVVDLDDVRWSPEGTVDEEEWPAVHRTLVARERWILSGDHRAVARERFEAADAVVWLDLPGLVCWWRACRRSSPVRRLDELRWIRRYPVHGRLETAASLRDHAASAAVFHLRRPRDVSRFVDQLARGR